MGSLSHVRWAHRDSGKVIRPERLALCMCGRRAMAVHLRVAWMTSRRCLPQCRIAGHLKRRQLRRIWGMRRIDGGSNRSKMCRLTGEPSQFCSRPCGSFRMTPRAAAKAADPTAPSSWTFAKRHRTMTAFFATYGQRVWLLLLHIFRTGVPRAACTCQCHHVSLATSRPLRGSCSECRTFGKSAR